MPTSDFEPTLDELLSFPFDPDKVHWRIGSTWNDGEDGIALAYLDARDVMQRLDDVMGVEGWSDSYEETASGRVICVLELFINDRWVSKSDGAGDTAFEGAKGAISDAFKRAAVKWGIGRYLYDLPVVRIKPKNKKYMPDDFNGKQYLPDTPAFKSKREKTAYYKGLVAAASEEDALKARELWDEMTSEQQMEIWRDMKHSSHIRSTIKKLLEDKADG